MARYNPIKNSFVAGETTPRIEGRDDLVQYHQSMRQAENGVVLPHGGFMRRSGTRFVKEVKVSADPGRLLPFEYSVTQAYVIEAGDLYFRFYTNEGRLDDGPPVEVTTPYLKTELYGIQFAQEADTLYLTHFSHPPYKLQRITSTTFTLAKVVFIDGEAPLRSPKLDASLTITVTGAAPYTLTASSAIFVLADDVGRAVRVQGGGDEGFFYITNVGSTTVATADLRGGAVPTGAQSNWSLGMFSDNQGPRAITFHEGRLVYGGTDPVVDRYVLSDSDNFDKFGPNAANDDEAIYRRTVSGSGKVNAIQWMASADEVMFIGTSGAEFKARGANNDIMTPTGTVTKPKTSRGSRHIMPILIDNNVIFAQRNGRKLRKLAFDLESDATKATDISILAEHILNKGILEMTYQQDQDSIIWVTRADGVLVGFTFEDQQKVVGAHRHIFGGSFETGHAVLESQVVIPEPNQTEDQLWCLVKRTINGVEKRYVEFQEEQFRPDVDALSTDTELIQAIEDDAWFIDSGIELPDSAQAITNITQASPAVVTMAGHPYSDGDEIKIVDVVGMTEVNKLTFLVANETAGAFELTDLGGDPVDSSGFTAYASGGVSRLMIDTVSGALHLAGETVQILADGAVHPDKVVSDTGVVTLDRKAAKVRLGKGFTTVGETNRFTGGGKLGSDQGQNTKIRRVVLRLHNTLGIEVGVGKAPELLESVIFRDGDDPMDASPPLFSGDVEVPLEGGWEGEPTIYFRQTQPLPMTVLSIMPRAESTEK